MAKLVMLNSGGLDSAMLAKYLHNLGHEVHSLFIDSVQLNTDATRIAAEETARRYCAAHKELRIDFGLRSNYYDDGVSGYDMYDLLTDEQRAAKTMRPFACPNMGNMFIHIAETYAIMIKAELTLGAFRSNFNTDMCDALNELTNMNPTLFYKMYFKAPASGCFTYDEVATKLGVTYEDLGYTHSCVWSEPCGVCAKCVDRKAIGLFTEV